jgi:hypothetical protein
LEAGAPVVIVIVAATAARHATAFSAAELAEVAAVLDDEPSDAAYRVDLVVQVEALRAHVQIDPVESDDNF